MLQQQGAEDHVIKQDVTPAPPLDERGWYSTKVVVNGQVYELKYWPCATAECLARNANLDRTDPGTQAYVRALDKKILDDVGMASAVVALVNPVGVAGVGATVVGTTASFAKGGIDGDLASPLMETALSAEAQLYLEHVLKLPKTVAARLTALIDLAGGWEAFAARLNPDNNPANKKDATRGNAK